MDCLSECLMCGFSVAYVLTGGVGPCGPTRDVPGIVRLIHRPGSWLAGLLVPDNSPLHLLMSLAATTVLLSLLAYTVLWRLHERNEKALP